jgi:hypothetical protein
MEGTKERSQALFRLGKLRLEEAMHTNQSLNLVLENSVSEAESHKIAQAPFRLL